ncbi:MAG: hypothetical protein NT066_02415 [Candidatus Omnitrophica bacterium]|nr:hypothetical protein [Candidatus Omnitrophota bacterium]
MRVSRFLQVITFITCLSLLYVYQETGIFRLAYAGQKKLALYQDLLDKNSFLRYNIKKYASLVQIGSKISGGTDFQMPDTYRFVRLKSPSENLRSAQKSLPRETLLSRLFSIKRQAEAKPINP